MSNGAWKEKSGLVCSWRFNVMRVRLCQQQQRKEEEGNTEFSCAHGDCWQHVCLLSVCLRCRALLSGRRKRTAVPGMYFDLCATPTAGCSATHALDAVAIGTCSVPSFRVARRKSTDSLNKRKKKKNQRIKNGPGIDPVKCVPRRKLRA